jgi:proliferating cell nuclear antigen PCNA
MWAAEAWGGYWSWDPKETWALIVWLNYAAWLHMRLIKGLRGPVLAWWAIIGLMVTTFAFIGVNMFHLFKLINSIDNDDTLTLYIEKKDYNDGIVSFLGLKFENGDIKQCKTQKLRLIEPDPEEFIEPNVVFSSVINLPSSDFQKIIRDMSCISEKLEIKSVGNELIFRCSGQFATAEIRRVETDGSMEFIQKQDSNKIIQGEFSLKNLGYFIKCTNLCSQIEMYLENDLPLVVKYYVASLGEIKLCLAPLPSSN